jgi:uncharacterized membrane protein
MEKQAKFILRFGLGIVFLYFGVNQFLSPEKWTALLPDFLSNLGNVKYFIYLNATFDILVAISLFFDLFLKLFSILGFLHLLAISLFSLGVLNPSGARDIGLGFAMLSLFFFYFERNLFKLK